MKKQKSIWFILLLGTALICSCCNNEDGLGGVKDAYLSLSIEFPSNVKLRGGGSDAKPTPGESGDGHEIGESSENEVKSLLVFGFAQGSQGTSFKKKIEKSDLTDLNTDNNEVHSYKTTQPFQVTSGKYHLYVMVNPTSEMESFDVTSGEASFKDKVINLSEINSDATELKIPDNDKFKGFPMSSADEIVVTEITSANTKGNPAFFKTSVQRLFAKVRLEVNKEDDFGSNGSKDKAKFAKSFKFTKYGIVNQRNSAYWFRRAGSSKKDAVIGVKDNKSNYIIDPIFDQKTSSYDESVAKNNYWNREVSSTFAPYWKNVEEKDKNVQYCFENTMTKDAQLQGYTTGLVLEARFIPKEENTEGESISEDKTFFKYGDKYYANKEALKKVLPSITGLPLVDDFTNDKEGESQKQEAIKKYAEYGVKVYYKGLCYYHYWIRHANDGNPNSMGIMEFATVRNNVYKMTVNSIKEPGAPTPPVDPEDPDENTNVYLDVRVEVLPWTIRENNMDL